MNTRSLSLLTCVLAVSPCLAQGLPPLQAHPKITPHTLYSGPGGALQPVSLAVTKDEAWQLVVGALSWSGAPPADNSWKEGEHMLLVTSSHSTSVQITEVVKHFPGPQLLELNPNGPPTLNAELVVTVIHDRLRPTEPGATVDDLQPTLHVVRIPHSDLPVRFEHKQKPGFAQITFAYSTETPLGKARFKVTVDQAGNAQVELALPETVNTFTRPLSAEEAAVLTLAYADAEVLRVPAQLPRPEPGTPDPSPFTLSVERLDANPSRHSVTGFLANLKGLEPDHLERFERLLQTLGAVQSQTMDHGEQVETPIARPAAPNDGVLEAMQDMQHKPK